MPEPPAGAAPSGPAPPAASGGPALASAPPSASPASPEETGPVFLDEEDGLEGPGGPPVPGAERDGGVLPELRPGGAARPAAPASAWQADAARQSGPDGGHEGRVHWPEPGSEPVPEPEESRAEARTSDPRGEWGGERAHAGAEGGNGPSAAPAPEPQVPGQGKREHTVGLRRSEAARTGTPPETAPAQPTAPAAPVTPNTPAAPAAPAVPGQGGTPASGRTAASPGQSQGQGQGRRVPGQGGGGAAPWQQQVHELAAPAASSAAPSPAPSPAPASPAPASPAAPSSVAPSSSSSPAAAAGGGLPAQPQSGGPDAVVPWRPPADDPFAQAARQARPAGLGRRLVARLVDLVLTLAVGGAVAFPFVAKATDHIDDKIDAVRQAGETQQVWLLDGTTGGYLAVVLGALLVFGLLYEVLPTARWGRTLGKKLCGVTVLDVEQQAPPGFARALVRWLLYGVLGLLAVGVVNVLWCVFDRPWRQCWHDKAARTYAAGSAR